MLKYLYNSSTLYLHHIQYQYYHNNVNYRIRQ